MALLRAAATGLRTLRAPNHRPRVASRVGVPGRWTVTAVCSYCGVAEGWSREQLHGTGKATGFKPGAPDISGNN